MPKQAIYTLASREAQIDDKIEFVRNYQGESKQEILSKIRKTFPLSKTDKRNAAVADKIIKSLDLTLSLFDGSDIHFTKEDKKQVLSQLKRLKSLLSNL
jgi:hypothetical protein